MARRDAFWPEDRAEIISNKVRCKSCGSVLVSRSEYENVQWCECGRVGIRGGCIDLVRVGDLTCIEELSEELLADGTQQLVRDRRYGGDDAGSGGDDSQPQEAASRLDGMSRDKWQELDDVSKRGFRRRRSWKRYPPWQELVVEYPELGRMDSFDSRTGAGLVLSKKRFLDPAEAIQFARHKRRVTAMSRLNCDGKLSDYVCMYLKTVEFVPYMQAGLLDNDLAKVLCPKCDREVDSYTFDKELQLCNSCVSARYRAIRDRYGPRYQKPYERHKGKVGEFLKDYQAGGKPPRDW